MDSTASQVQIPQNLSRRGLVVYREVADLGAQVLDESGTSGVQRVDPPPSVLR